MAAFLIFASRCGLKVECALPTFNGSTEEQIISAIGLWESLSVEGRKAVLDAYHAFRARQPLTALQLEEGDGAPCFIVGTAEEVGFYPARLTACDDAGYDLRFAADTAVPPGGAAAARIPLGARIRCWEGGQFVAWDLVPRSSIGKTPLIQANSPGVIDAGYTGEVLAQVRNLGSAEYVVERGAALFQAVAPSRKPARVIVVAANHPIFSGTARGSAGFGSTGAAGSGGSGVNAGAGTGGSSVSADAGTALP